MAEEIRAPEGRLEHPDVRFEPKDANASWIFGIIAMTAAFLIAIHFIVLAFFHGYEAHLAEVNRSPYPLARRPDVAFPAKPRLEQIDRLSGDTEVNVFVRESKKLRRLDTYGKADTEGFVHIPVEKAMRYAIDKKMLKARPEPPANERDRSSGLIDAGAPNSGRWLRGGGK